MGVLPAYLVGDSPWVYLDFHRFMIQPALAHTVCHSSLSLQSWLHIWLLEYPGASA